MKVFVQRIDKTMNIDYSAEIKINKIIKMSKIDGIIVRINFIGVKSSLAAFAG